MASCVPRTGGVFFHDDGVLVRQRLAFRAVGDDGIRLGVELHVRRKTATARLPYFFCEIHFNKNALGPFNW